MNYTTEVFTDIEDDSLEVAFHDSNGTLDFDGEEGISAWSFDTDESLRIAKFLVERFNTLTPLPLVNEVQAKPARSLAVEVHGSSARESFNLTAFQAAKELGLGVKFNYSKGNVGSIEPRDLAEVEKVELTSKNHTIVVGYDEDREDPRTFRVDWIKGFVTVTD